MTVRDVFGLIVRLAGLGLIVMGIFNSLGGLLVAVGLPMQGSYPLRDVVAGALLWFVVGIALIGLAEQITKLAYGKSRSASERQT